ncbi:hypothetical protein BTO06_00200 [Tenacibaculum sp. SZ-18]|uniref:T9SS type A sorting domain-containing protein n=1 Tax=Tenacibaculum sp. SZ-18 TaxID=754423 RepID=UPI000C2CEC91|nr:T9SS type A sorting domain-containing protein [Tenacibaculum sp. SZ-18]AUC13659.1 hypothetical protein BTO06_00200 [Tenacibaculum sp. SZ-18]
MSYKYIILLLFVGTLCHGQYKTNSPWDLGDAQRKGAKPTLKEMASQAEKYFSTIDASKKGSGLKPFKRWENNWSHYLNEDGTIASKEKLWDAWRVKNALHGKSAKNNTNVSDWKSLGPFSSTSRYFSDPTKTVGQGRVNTIAVDPNDSNTYYVGSPAGGIWKSTDAGINWTPLRDYLPQIGVSGIAIDPNNSDIIYIATGDDDSSHSYAVGVWKSTDGGTTWNNTGAIPGNPDNMNEIYIFPNNSRTIIVATSTGLQKSINGGVTWSTKLTGYIDDIKMKPGDPNIWYAVSRNMFYRSTDRGETFTAISLPGLTNSGRLTMDVTDADDAYVYVVSATVRDNDLGLNYNFNGIYKSTNSGITFTKTAETNDIFGSTQAWYDLALTVSDKDKDIVYVGVLDLWKSTNGGDNFSQINKWDVWESPNYTHADIHFLRFLDGKLFAGTDGGIYVSEDEGVNFTYLTENIAISQFYRISISQEGREVIAGGLQDNGGFGYNNSGWRHYHGGDGMEGIVDPNDSQTYYGFTQYGGYLNITNDSGISLSRQIGSPPEERGPGDSGGEWITPMAITSNSEIYAGYSQVYKFNGTNGWDKISDHNFEDDDIDRLVINPENNDIMYVAQGEGLHRSSDRGVTFTKINFDEGTIRGIATDPSDEEAIWVATSNNVHKITNITGSVPTKTVIGTNIPLESLTVIKHHKGSDNNTLYLGTTLGVYFINDDLTEWQSFDTNLPNTQIRDLEIHELNSTLYAGTFGRGIFYSDIPTSSVLSAEDDVFLSGISIYPNPSQNIFNIKRTTSDELTVKVLDLTGKQVFTKKNITDTTFEIDMSSYSSGIYIMNMSSNGKIATKKLIKR